MVPVVFGPEIIRIFCDLLLFRFKFTVIQGLNWRYFSAGLYQKQIEKVEFRSEDMKINCKLQMASVSAFFEQKH